MIGRSGLRRLGIAMAVAALVLGVVGLGSAWSQGPPDDDPAQPPRPDFRFAGECDADTGDLVVSGEMSNETEHEMTVVIGLAELTLGPSGLAVDERIDLSHLFPETLPSGESVSLGPADFSGDQWWKVNLLIRVEVEGSDTPMIIGSPDDPPSPPCTEESEASSTPEPPAVPPGEEPAE